MKTRKLVVFVILFIALYGCANHGDRYDNNQTPNAEEIDVPIKAPGMIYEGANSEGDALQPDPIPAAPSSPGKPSLIKMYVENSGSIFGYVNGATEYVDALTEIAQLPDFVTQKIPVDISFVNGANPITITHLGNTFGNKLNPKGMNVGNTKLSDLNTMFDTILAEAKNDIITILVSDAIYDIGTNSLSALITKGKDTRTAFLQRLSDPTANLQTLLVKMSSLFNGTYYYATKKGSVNISQQRPYYIWVIGNSEMVNAYFNDRMLKTLDGYQNHVRYVKVENNKLPFVIDPITSTVKIDHRDSHTLKPKPIHGHFDLAIIVDFDNLHYSDAYLMDINNYSCDYNFTISSISLASRNQTTSAGVNNYKRPFLIKLSTNQNPQLLRGILTLKLRNTQPGWIVESNASNEDNIDTITTYGFSTLTKGIREAYEHPAVSDSIPAVFEIKFK